MDFFAELDKINESLGIGRRGQSADVPLAANEIPRSLLKVCYECGSNYNVSGTGFLARCGPCHASLRQMYAEQEARDRMDIDEDEPDQHREEE